MIYCSSEKIVISMYFLLVYTHQGISIRKDLLNKTDYKDLLCGCKEAYKIVRKTCKELQ